LALLLGIDVSTTATKALLIDEKGEIIGSASTSYELDTPQPLWSEQSPPVWWFAAVQSIRQLLAAVAVNPATIAAIGLTGQMHGLVLLGDDHRTVRPAILWNDQRTGRQSDEIRTRVGRERLLQITGNDAFTGFTAPKILWVREHETENWAKTRYILLPKDYLRHRLTGVIATDKADAAGTLLFDLQQRDWSHEMLSALAIPHTYLPPTHEGPTITSYLTEAAAVDTGLREGTPVVAGAGDQAAQALGAGVIRSGLLSISLGTSGVLFASTGQPLSDSTGRLHSFCHAIPDRWHMMGVTLSAGGSLRWLRDTVAPGADYGSMVEAATNIASGSEGLLFLPYLTGERTPHADPLARGAFVGLTLRHTPAHLTRALLEGVAFALRDSFTLMRAAGLPTVQEVRITGGGARSPLWRQIIADVLNVELVSPAVEEGAAYGAALLAGAGVGVWPSLDDACDSLIRLTGRTLPNPRTVERYDLLYAHYRALYPALQRSFHALAGF
jgi:xylulokinase